MLKTRKSKHSKKKEMINPNQNAMDKMFDKKQRRCIQERREALLQLCLKDSIRFEILKFEVKEKNIFSFMRRHQKSSVIPE